MNNKPLKVLIVDDESNTRGLVKLSVDWGKLGMEVVGDATSGLEAIDLMDILEPDIILTDIQMPYMDGLSLSKTIKESHPDVGIVILTAHDEFSYAQSAVSIGVSDFILKPIDKAILNETMSRVAQKIQSQKLRLNELELSHHYFKSNIAVFQNKVLNDLISSSSGFSFQPDELDMVELNFDTDYDRYQISLINIAIEKSRYTNIERQVILQNCCAYLKDICIPSGHTYVFTDIYNNIVLLNNNASISLNDISDHALAYFKEQFSAVVSCGIGMPVQGIGNVHSSYTQALNALNMCYVTGEEISFADSQMNEYESGEFYRKSAMDNLKLAIKSGATSQAISFAKELIHDYAKEYINDLDGVRLITLNVSTYIKELLNEMRIAFMGDLSLSGEALLQPFKLDRFSDIENNLLSIVEKACTIITEALNSKNNSVVTQIKNYIDENFNDYELTLKVVADKFFINSSYLSRIFKKTTGISFSEYMIKIRIEKATSMLQLQDYKAYQLAQIVGIPDPNYFVKCFKKIVGIPFAEYKMMK